MRRRNANISKISECIHVPLKTSAPNNEILKTIKRFAVATFGDERRWRKRSEHRRPRRSGNCHIVESKGVPEIGRRKRV
jgi:hypothetical protein